MGPYLELLGAHLVAAAKHHEATMKWANSSSDQKTAGWVGMAPTNVGEFSKGRCPPKNAGAIIQV